MGSASSHNASAHVVNRQKALSVPSVVTVTDLGPGNEGSISTCGLPATYASQLVADVASPTYRRMPTVRFRCIDGRLPEGGLRAAAGKADPQTAGGSAISESMADFMVQEHPPKLSVTLAQNVLSNIKNGYQVVVHGDTHRGKAGCGANERKRAVLISNARNQITITSKAWLISKSLRLDKWLQETDIVRLIMTGKNNAMRPELWDVDDTAVVDLALANGAEYEELAGDHRERVIVADTSGFAFDEALFMDDHRFEDQPVEAFVVSLGAVTSKLFTIARTQGASERDAALKAAAVVLFNIGVSKALTAESDQHGARADLPVVVLG